MMTYLGFKQHYYEQRLKWPDYRFGQCFIWLFIKESSDVELCRLWEERDVIKAEKLCIELIERYNWDYSDLPVLVKEV